MTKIFLGVVEVKTRLVGGSCAVQDVISLLPLVFLKFDQFLVKRSPARLVFLFVDMLPRKQAVQFENGNKNDGKLAAKFRKADIRVI